VATNFPTSLDSLTNPTSTDSLTSPSHAGQHADANDAIEALQAKVGVNSSAVTSSLDYKVEGLLAVSQSNRNVIINGGFDVWQRGTSSTVTGNTYLADRFMRAIPTGGTQSQETDVPSGEGFRYSWKHVASATNSYMQMGQQIEFANCKHLQNKAVTISFWAKAINSNAGSTGLTVRTRTVAGVDGAAIFAGTNSDTSVTLTTSWVRYTVARTLPATFGALSLEFALGSHVSGDGFFLTGVQLEEGAVATPFEFENISTTLAKCQRYYFRRETSGIAYQTLANGWNDGTNALFVLEFPVAMRTSPTSFQTAAAANFYLETGGAGVATSIVVAGYRATTTSMQTILSKAGLTALGANLLSDNTDIAYIAASAEF
jgi:hypothetical protein